jgi:hypothetical protein
VLLLSAAGADAQVVRTAILPDTITVGDVVSVAVRIGAPRGATIEFPDSLVLPQDLENAGSRVIRNDTAGSGMQVTATFPIAGWRPGTYALPAIPYRINGVAYEAALDSLRIQSVLPADTAGIQPKPLKGVLGGERVWWPWLAALLLLALAAVAYYLWRRRRRAVVAVAAPARPAREVALEKLDAARADGLIERGEMKAFYTRMSDALRSYIAAVDAPLSMDLTTSESAGRMRARGADPAGVALLTMLGAADLVKFARRTPSAAEAEREWTRIRAWVAEATWPPRTGAAAGDERSAA